MPQNHRIYLTVVAGAFIALIGFVVFLAAHGIATPRAGVVYSVDDRDLHETLWAAFGLALLIAGAIVASAGLSSWCRGGNSDAR